MYLSSLYDKTYKIPLQGLLILNLPKGKQQGTLFPGAAVHFSKPLPAAEMFCFFGS